MANYFETVEVPISSSVFRGVDQVELSDANYSLIDGYTSFVGGTNKRPGLLECLDFALGSNRIIDGMYWWEQQNKLVVASAGYLLFVTYSSGAFSFDDLGASAFLELNAPVIFASDSTDVYACNGGKIVHSDGTTTTIEMADADAPTTVTHIALLDGYLIANSTSENKVYYSQPLTPKVWDNPVEYFSAIGNSDDVTALIVHNREIFCMGPQTIEIWENDGITPFSRISGGFIETGVIAPYSVVKTENGLFWLNHNKKFVEFNGREIKYISSGYDKDIQGFDVVTDCIGMRIEIEGQPFLIFTFKSERRTLVYNYLQEEWMEWSTFVSATNSRVEWLANAYAYSPNWGMHLVGSNSESKISLMSPEYPTDNGESIVLERVTGHLDWKIPRRKRARYLHLRVKRGGGEIHPSTPQLMVRWKDDNKNWSQEHYFDLGAIGETEISRRILCSGIFRTRQFEFKVSDNVPISFISAQIEIEELLS